MSSLTCGFDLCAAYSCNQAMSTVATAGICQQACCSKGDGGASRISCVLNAIGKWGTVVAASVQNKPVVVGKNGVAVGATGSSLVNPSSTVMLIIAALVVALLVFAIGSGGRN